jgi:hypothetical protein
VTYYKISPSDGAHLHGLALRHGWYDGPLLYRAWPPLPSLSMPLQRRLHVTEEGLTWLKSWRTGDALLRAIDRVASFHCDWPREIAAPNVAAPRNRMTYVSRSDAILHVDIWEVMAARVCVGADDEVVGDRVVKVPVLSRRDVSHLDLLEFDFGPWVWQVVSGEMALAIEALLPGAFKLTRVSVL